MIFTLSLFIGLCSVTSYPVTGYSHSYHSIKLIHYSALQRDVLSNKMVFWVVTHRFYFMLCQSSLLSTVISFVYKDKWWSMKACQLFSVWKIFEKEFFYSLYTLNQTWKLCYAIEEAVRRERPGRMKSIIQKGIIRVRTQSQDSKLQTSRPSEVQSSGQVRSQHLLFVQF